MGRIPEFNLLAVILFSTLALASAQRRQYCAWRGCCPGRDDNCHTPFHDTLCYCDEFCQRTDSDCCPDYYGSLCHLTPAPPTLPTPTASGDGCDFEGKSYTLGETVEDNCNTCACQFVDGNLEFVCTIEICAIEMPRVEEINDEDPGWFARNYTDFWGKTVDRARRYYTGTKHPQHLVLRQYEVNIEDVENLPKSFDARDKWPGWIGGVQEQGACGSSWAVSTVAVSSDRLAIQSQGMFNKQLSAQHIISCHLQQSQGCDGGHTDSAYWFLRRRGVVTEECYPLMSGQSEETEMMRLPCRLGYKSSYPCPNRGVTSDLKQVPPAYRIASDANEIMYEIKENGPVQAHFLVKSDFFSYGGGVYRHMGDDSDLPGPDSYHSVRILGWGVDEFGTPYWLCANSWGRDWGEDGYFRIVRGENECEIESFVVAVWGQVDPYMMNTGDLRP